MAEGMFNALCKKYGLNMQSQSAGTGVPLGSRASQNSIAALEQWGIDITGHYATPIYHTDIEDFFKICVMEQHHKNTLVNMGIAQDKIVVLNESAGGISDPYGCDLKRYIQCRNEILRAIKEEFFANKKIKLGNMIL
jgi:protein-tyrosine-phosphatase